MTGRTNVVIVGLMLAVLLLNGCIVIVDEQEPRSQGPVIHESADPTVREIRAVRTMDFDSQKAMAYTRIAQRNGLSDEAQSCLVAEVFKHLSFESSQQLVLVKLIENPSFSEAGERAILDHLDELHFENNKALLLSKINARKSAGSTETVASPQA